MAWAIHRRNKTFQRVGADKVNNPVADWILRFDLSQVGITDLSTHKDPINTKYWKIVGDDVTLMSPTEKDAEDARLADELLDVQRAGYKATADIDKLFKAFAKILVDEINILRANDGLTPRTFTQLKNAIKSQIDNE